MGEPAYSFPIPSLADDTPLDCRIYHPPHFEAILANAAENEHPTRGAIVAHPYAPLGGNHDDSVVLAVVRCLLKEGFVVGTFNFRGAPGSKGSSSWTGRPEREDYTSFIGFMIHYLQQLQPINNPGSSLSTIPSSRVPQSNPSPSDGNSTPPPPTSPSNQPTTLLLLSGYSYGSLILTRLSPLPAIQSRFDAAPAGTSAAEIILRARRLADETHHTLSQTVHSEARGRSLTSSSPKPRLHAAASPVVLGGEESDPSLRQGRRSRETSRGAALVRRSVEVPHRIKAHIHRRRGSGSGGAVQSEDDDGAAAAAGGAELGTGTRVRVSYLLISPLLPPLAHALVPPASVSGLRGGFVDRGSGFGSLREQTLVVWGEGDGFTASKRLKGWAERMVTLSEGDGEKKGNFRWVCVEGAGHFWREEGAMKRLVREVGKWIKEDA